MFINLMFINKYLSLIPCLIMTLYNISLSTIDIILSHLFGPLSAYIDHVKVLNELAPVIITVADTLVPCLLDNEFPKMYRDTFKGQTTGAFGLKNKLFHNADNIELDLFFKLTHLPEVENFIRCMRGIFKLNNGQNNIFEPFLTEDMLISSLSLALYESFYDNSKLFSLWAAASAMKNTSS